MFDAGSADARLAPRITRSARALTLQKTDGKLDKHQAARLVGLVMWRAGLLLAASSALYNTIKFALRFIDLPTQLEIGIGLIASGCVFVVSSFIMERVIDYRGEGDLSK